MKNTPNRFRRGIQKRVDLILSRRVDISHLQTVALFLGPYRNLTTLLSSIIALHPTCQVLNHGGMRILGDSRLDFIAQQDKRILDQYARYAIHISSHGQRGRYGGSIINSHAFDEKHPMAQMKEQASGVKDKIESLTWKESLLISRHLRQHQVNLNTLFATYPQLRFIVPIRHPLDSVQSNKKTGHMHYVGVPKTVSDEELLDAVLAEHLWSLFRAQAHPDRFFVLFEPEFDRQHMIELASFLEVEPSESWLDAVELVMNITSHYDHPQSLIDHYLARVDEKFNMMPEFAQKLRAFYTE